MSLAAGSTRLGLFRKVLRLNWALILLVGAIATIGFLMLFSVAGGSPAARWSLGPGAR